MDDRRVPIGRIVGLYGVRGEVKLESWAEPRSRIFDYQPWCLQTAGGETLEIQGVEGRSQGRGIVAALPGITDRDQAMALLEAEISVARSVLPAPAEGEYYWTDLEGLEVITLQGERLGWVSHLVATGANDVLVVRDEGAGQGRAGHRERLIPFVIERYVHAVDLERGRLEVDWDPEF